MERGDAERAGTARRAKAATALRAMPPLRDIRDAPAYQLAALASLSDRKGQAMFAAKFGVSLGEWRVLANIFVQPRVTLAKLCRSMLLDKGQLSRTVQRLAQRQWVVARAAPGIRGALQLEVTPLGRRKYAVLMRHAAARNAQLMSALTPEEQDCFVTCLRKLRAHVERQYAMEVEGRAAPATAIAAE